MGFFTPANERDQGGESSDDEDDVVEGAADDEVRDEAGESLPARADEDAPPV